MDEDFPTPPFVGFPESGFAFLEELARTQDKTWVADNKQVYERDLRAPLSSLVTCLTDRLKEAGVPLRGNPKRSLFRLNRDVRFSKDKSPYKTHVSAVLTRSGDKSDPGCLYLHVDPSGSFMAAGFFQPEPDVLNRLRLGLVENEARWEDVSAALTDAGLALGTEGALVRLPKGFGPASASIEAALKMKSWHVKRELARGSLSNASLPDAVVAFAEAAEPLLRFGWSALDHHPARAGASFRTR